MPTTTLWPIEPHTAAKHAVLREYLKGWFPVIGSGTTRALFLDGFAGPGVYAGGQPGSPVIALQTYLAHRSADKLAETEFVFIFNERDSDRFAVLEDEVEKVRQGDAGGKWPANVKVHINDDTFPAMAESILGSLTGKSLAPTFAFLDPFGYRDVPMDVISRLLAFDKCELLIYFDFNSASRFATSGVVDLAFTALYGTEEFAAAPPAGDPRRREFLHDLYARQLRDVAGFTYVQSFEMINKHGKIGHYLFYCTRNTTALRIMKEAMWRVAPSGDYRFSDRLAGQEVLFGGDAVDTGPLRDALLAAFGGKEVAIEALERFTLVKTPYVPTMHLKKKTLVPMQEAGLISARNQKRRNTYPAGTSITFGSGDS